MSSSSNRLMPVNLHQHEEPPIEPERETSPVPCCEEGKSKEQHVGRLWREDGKVMFQAAEGGEATSVRLVWARPLSGRGGPVSVMLASKKREVAYLASLDELPACSRRVAEEELSNGLVLPVITTINQVNPRFGNYYWDVETTMGHRRFLLTSPENNTIRPRPDVVILRDVSGNCYEISSISGLSRASRREMERVL